MKKVYVFIAFVLMSSVIFAQTKRISQNAFSSVKVEKVIYNNTSSKAIVDSLHYDDVNADAIGTNSADTFAVFAFFPSSLLSAHNALSNTITQVKVFINTATNVTSAKIKFYSNQTTEVLSQAFTPIEGWNTVTLTTPYPIPAADLYIGYEVVVTTGYVMGCDGATTANPNGNWMLWGGAWYHLTDLNASLTYNWNIRAMVEGTALTNPIASCSPASWDAGTIPNNTTTSSLPFTLTNVGAGTLTVSAVNGLTGTPFTCDLVPANVNLTSQQSATFSFTYSPTAVGTHTATCTIQTNGGDITVNLTGTAVACPAINTFPWTESFEGASFPPACWNVASPDGGTGWASIASGTTPLPGWQGGTMTVPTNGGTKAAYCTWSTGGTSANDQWLITPQIAVQANQELSFYIFWFGHYQENVDIKVSTTTSAVASFTTSLLTLDTTQFIHNSWKMFTINLSSYAGQNVYFAFNEHVADNYNDGAFIGLDLVMVAAASGIDKNNANAVSIYPNPVNNTLYVMNEKAVNVEIYNLQGQCVANYANENVINVSNLAQGTYLVKVTTNNKVITQKINIVR